MSVDDDKFEKELTDLLNRYSVDNFMNTPDFLLADYLIRHLRELEVFTRTRTGYKIELK